MSGAGARRKELWRRVRLIADNALRLVLPPACIACRRPGELFCGSCVASLVWFDADACAGCGRQLPAKGLPCAWCEGRVRPLREVRATCHFKGAARAAIHALKYEGMFGAAAPMAGLMAERYPEWTRIPDIVAPIPLHPERVRERGYNQATYLARHLCGRLGLQLDEAALQRTRPTRPQVGLDRLQRRQNVAGAFTADGERVRGKRVLLVDDVCTSGATLAAAAEALLAEGCADVSGYCFARPLHSVDV